MTQKPTHPGQFIAENWLVDYGLTASALARHLAIPARRVRDIIAGRRGISADTAARLGRHFRNSPMFWLNLQIDFDLRTVDARRITREVRPMPRP